jgi:hypothetical protein
MAASAVPLAFQARATTPSLVRLENTCRSHERAQVCNASWQSVLYQGIFDGDGMRLLARLWSTCNAIIQLHLYMPN